MPVPNGRRFAGLRATVMGLGRFGGGVAAAAWLAEQGARVTVTDLADEQTLAESLAQTSHVPLAGLHLGGHRDEDFRSSDLLVVNPAVPPGNGWVELARRGGAEITTELGLLLQHCGGRLIGVTGSNGKSTTAAMIHAILSAADPPAAAGQPHGMVWLGGNLGGSLLPRLDEIAPTDWVVLEMSSFQLTWIPAGMRMPELAVITGCTPNHLDWHGDFWHYAAAKRRLIADQDANHAAVLNTADPEVKQWVPAARGRVVPLISWDDVPPLSLPGAHQRLNARLAASAAEAIGVERPAIERGLASVSALPHRLQPIASIGDVTFYDDSAATTPESTIAALRAVERPIWLLAGGKGKGCEVESLAAEIVARVEGVAFFGSVAEQLAGCCRAMDDRIPIDVSGSLASAFDWCARHAAAGRAVVLSPGFSSQDQFASYVERAACFRSLVGDLHERRNR